MKRIRFEILPHHNKTEEQLELDMMRRKLGPVAVKLSDREVIRDYNRAIHQGRITQKRYGSNPRKDYLEAIRRYGTDEEKQQHGVHDQTGGGLQSHPNTKTQRKLFIERVKADFARKVPIKGEPKRFINTI